MGHYDVVPVEESTEDGRRHPPFAGAVAGGYVWGRGTLDDKSVSLSLFVAATDSRHFHDLTHDIYRFRPIRATPDDRQRLHGTDERISVENYAEMIQFQIRLLQNATSQV